MTKAIFLFYTFFISSQLLGQANESIHLIDSIVNGNESKIVAESTFMLKYADKSSHGDINWNIYQVIKYKDGSIPVSVQKIWADRDAGCDTFQVNTYFFSENRLVKFTVRYLKPGEPVYYQNFYYLNEKLVSGVDSEGKSLDSSLHVKHARKILRRIRKHREVWVF